MRLLATKFFAVAIVAILVASSDCSAKPDDDNTWKNVRGFTIKPSATEADIHALAATGANVARIDFSTLPLITGEEPYRTSPEAMKRLKEIVSWCGDNDVRVVIDPHTVPGAQHRFTMSPNDKFWTTPSQTRALVSLWEEISTTFRSNSTVLAYDLLNEPSAEYKKTEQAGTEKWNDIANRLIKTIRNNGDNHFIVVEPAAVFKNGLLLIGRFEGIRLLRLPEDDRIVISPHMYTPTSFTHQGIYGIPVGCRYPGTCAGKYWDKSELERAMKPAEEPSIKNRWPIYIGEFSASSFTGPDGIRYLRDLIDIFEKNRWAWTYHMFRGAAVWDPETAPNEYNGTPSTNSNRITTLEYYLKKNQQTNPVNSLDNARTDLARPPR